MVENLREKALTAYDGIFNNLETIEIDGYKYYLDHTPRKGLRLYKVEGYSYLEQNPETGNNWAKMAREDHSARVKTLLRLILVSFSDSYSSKTVYFSI